MPPPTHATTTIEFVAAFLFGIAILHTFATGLFERLARRSPRHAGIWHLLGEVEVVFGFWALVLVLCMAAVAGRADAVGYLESRNFTEPLFVFAIMVVAGTRPVLQLARRTIEGLAGIVPAGQRPAALYFLTLTLVPLTGSFITEPAAMTLAALMLRDGVLAGDVSARFRYATLGTLFVNVSIGGTLTHFAAPPVLMVATAWHWDLPFMLQTFGWKAAIAVTANALLAVAVFRPALRAVVLPAPAQIRVPPAVVAVHLGFLLLVVVSAHHPVIFLGALLFFLGFAHAYERHQDPLILKEALMVAFFLAGLVVLGGQQAWWLAPLLLGLDAGSVYYGATALTAVTDNAALTYLASLVPGLAPDFKVALVAGAVTGGGLTVIANAPNPAGAAILRGRFGGAIHPLGLLLGALVPTLVAIAAFRIL